MPRQEAPTLTLHPSVKDSWMQRERTARAPAERSPRADPDAGAGERGDRRRAGTFREDRRPHVQGTLERPRSRTGHPMETTVATTVAIQQKHDEGVPPTLGLRPRPQPGHVSTPPHAGFTRTGIEGWSQTAWVSWSAP